MELSPVLWCRAAANCRNGQRAVASMAHTLLIELLPPGPTGADRFAAQIIAIALAVSKAVEAVVKRAVAEDLEGLAGIEAMRVPVDADVWIGRRQDSDRRR